MSKDKISDYSATANSNTDIAGINIDEGCAPSGINNAIRTLMKQLKDFQQGTNSDPFNGPTNGAHNGTVGATTPSTGAFTTLSASGVTTLSAGSASAPALTTSGDTNTGVLFPAADTVAITTGGTERTRVDSSGNLIIGDTSAGGAKLKTYYTSTSPSLSDATGAGLSLHGSSTVRLNFGSYGTSPYATWMQTNDASGNAFSLVINPLGGNLGLGVTPSAWGSSNTAFQIGNGAIWKSGSRSVDFIANGYYNGTNYIYNTTNAATYYRQIDGQHQWYNAASGTAGNAITFTQAMTLDASGNLGVGTTSPSSYGKFAVVGSGTTTTVVDSGSSRVTTQAVGTGGSYTQYYKDLTPTYVASVGAYSPATSAAVSGIVFADYQGGWTERARIDSSGNLLVGATSGIASERIYVNGSVANYLTRNYNSNASPYGILVSYTGAAPNGTSNEFIRFDDTGALRASIRSNGGLANYSANNANLSDVRTKTDIQDAGNYLAKICAIPVRTFKYKDQTDDLLNLGVIAQEVEAVAPELVDVSGFGETPEDGVPLKAIYQTDLQYALMKALQELKAEFEAYKATHP